MLAIEEDGVNCIGYFVWNPIDLVSATSGEYRKGYGFIYVDKHDDNSGTLNRYKKASVCCFYAVMLFSLFDSYTNRSIV